MSGVFLSYSRADRALAEDIIRGLRAVGVVVWWDEDMRSIDWHQELERQIVELASIVVLWTPSSANSDHVKDEARLGLESGKLINAIVGVGKPPFPYDRVNGLPLDDWTELEPHSGWTRLIETIEEKVVERGGAKPGEFTSALAQREESLRIKQQALARAQEALEEAQTREAETIDAAQAAQATFDRAEEQHLRVMEMRATHLIMSAAQQEYEAARAAKEDADRALRAAKAEIKGVAREVALAIAALESQVTPANERRGKSAPDPGSAKARVVEPAPPPVPEPVPAVEPSKPPKARAAPPPEPEPEPAPSPAAAASASAAAAIPATPTRSPDVHPAAPSSGAGGLRLIAAVVGVVVVVGVIAFGALLVLGHHPRASAKPALSAASIASAAAPASVAAPPSVDPTAAAVKAAGALVGNWAPQGLTCDNPITIAVKDGAVSMTVGGSTSKSTIEASPGAGVTDAKGEDGGKYTYTLGQDQTLSMVDPSGQTMKMTKCAG
jgi:hypothetical protein